MWGGGLIVGCRMQVRKERMCCRKKCEWQWGVGGGRGGGEEQQADGDNVGTGDEKTFG